MKNIVIDARERIGGELIALMDMCESKVIAHWLDFAKLLSPSHIYILGAQSSDELKRTAKDAAKEVPITFVDILPEAEDCTFVGGNKVYSLSPKNNLRTPDDCILWVIRSKEDIASAEAELIKNGWFPIARYYLEPIARNIAAALKNSKVTPNHITYTGFFLGLTACFLIATGTSTPTRMASVFLLLFWLFDITDGKLARLKKCVSPFGGWLDNVSGEFIDYALHFSILLGIYASTGKPWILWLGISYFIGKHLFLYLMQAAATSFHARKNNELYIHTVDRKSVVHFSIRVAHLLHDSDVRIHFLAISMLLDLTWMPLLVYALYYNVWVFCKIILEYRRNRQPSDQNGIER